eukprot:9247827-Pyramimonas_sp.AAC.1
MLLAANLAIGEHRWAGTRDGACARVIRRAVGVVGGGAQGTLLPRTWPNALRLPRGTRGNLC